MSGRTSVGSWAASSLDPEGVHMRFFVVTRDRSTDALALPVLRAFPSRAEALSVAGGAVADDPDVEVFIADLDVASPVFVLVAGDETARPHIDEPPSEDLETVEAPEAEQAAVPGSQPPAERASGFAQAIRDAAASMGLDISEDTGAPDAGTTPPVEGSPELADEPDTGPDEAPAAELGYVFAPDETSNAVRPEPETPYVPLLADIAGWTCERCVYVVTCPKSGSDRPVTCVSFQWKSE
jgi:hypothetical protein